MSKAEQRRQLLERIDEPDKNWKFNAGDLDERELWDEYLAAYNHALRATSRPWAPWYAIPADDKHYLRWHLAHLVNHALGQLGVDFPRPDEKARAALEKAKKRLLAQAD
jgi:polyphosphate kinase 2 (PPK2 family)